MVCRACLLRGIFAAEVCEVSGFGAVCSTALLALYETMFESATATAASRPCKWCVRNVSLAAESPAADRTFVAHWAHGANVRSSGMTNRGPLAGRTEAHELLEVQSDRR